MKKIIGLLVVMFALGGVVQAQKIGHIVPNKILSDMPLYKKRMSELEDLQKSMQQKLARMDSSLNSEYLRCSQENISEFEKKECQESLADMQQRIQRKSSEYEQLLSQKQAEIQQELYDTLQVAIKAVGKEGGFTYIIDGSSTYYVDGGIDLTNKVRAKLGLPALTGTEP